MHCSHVSPTIPKATVERSIGISHASSAFREYAKNSENIPITASGKLTDRSRDLRLFMILTSDYGSDRRSWGAAVPRMNFAFRQGLSLTAWEREHSPVDYGSLVRIYKQWNDPAGHVRDKFMKWSPQQPLLQNTETRIFIFTLVS